MSTRSMIARKLEDGSIEAIYCHWDGYPEHNGLILLRYYADPEKLDQLFALGDLSILEKEIGEKHSFDKRITDLKVRELTDSWCCAYERDRGETGVESRNYTDREEFELIVDASWANYAYLWDGEVWQFRCVTMEHNRDWQTLTVRVCTKE